MFNLFEKLVCANCRSRGLRLSTTAPRAEEPIPEYGYAVCDGCNSLYPIAAHILDLAPRATKLPLTLAGRSNDAPLSPEIYEKVWRPLSLSLMTGERFSLARELALVNEWAQPTATDLIMDLGTCTGLYARSIARASGGRANIVALDHAWGMLAYARHTARREGLTHIAYLRAFAQTLPFPDASVDVIVCGGSLNEFRSMSEALREMRRVLNAQGHIVMMSLLRAQGALGKWAQGFLGLSGIHFPTLDAFNRLVPDAGLRIAEQEIHGIVTFTRIEKIASGDEPRAVAPRQLVMAH